MLTKPSGRKPSTKLLAKPSYCLLISDLYFIHNYFIPFLNNLTWLSKKQQDFKDWVLISKLVVKGLHLTKEGLAYILQIKSRMNNGRLSTNKDNPNYSNLPLPEINSINLKPLYELTSEGTIKEISTSKLITNVKYYKLTEVNNTANSIYLTPAELITFLGYTKSTVYLAIKQNKILMSKNTGLYYSLALALRQAENILNNI